jgi:hypothetical protein
MSPSAIIHTPNWKTPNTTTTANTTATLESVGHRPRDTNLIRSKDRREDRAICLLTPPIEMTPRWRKSRGKLFWRDTVSSIEATPQRELSQPNYTGVKAPGSPPPPIAGAADGGGRDQRGLEVWSAADGIAAEIFSSGAGNMEPSVMHGGWIPIDYLGEKPPW